MNYTERKQFQRANSSRKPTDEHTLKIMLTESNYTDRGLNYSQYTSYTNPAIIEQMELVKCEICGVYMDGGMIHNQGTPKQKHLCYACSKETNLKELFEAMDKRDAMIKEKNND